MHRLRDGPTEHLALRRSQAVVYENHSYTDWLNVTWNRRSSTGTLLVILLFGLSACANSPSAGISADPSSATTQQSSLGETAPILETPTPTAIETTSPAVSPPAPQPSAIVDTGDAPDPIVYALGSEATTKHPTPNCSEVVANWTATNGPVWVTVMVDGPTSVTVTINGEAATEMTFDIEAGQDTHVFEYPSIDPSSVRTVLVTVGDSPQEVGGSCFATGSPTN